MLCSNTCTEVVMVPKYRWYKGIASTRVEKDKFCTDDADQISTVRQEMRLPQVV